MSAIMKTILALAVTFILTISFGYVHTQTLFLNEYLNRGFPAVRNAVSSVAIIIILLAFVTGYLNSYLKRFSKLTHGIIGVETSGQDSNNMILKSKKEISTLSVDLHNASSQLAETQNELITHLDFEKLLVEISTKFINLPLEKFDEGIDQLLKVFGEFFEVDRSYILLLRKDDTSLMDNNHEWCAENILSLKDTRQNILIDHSQWWIKSMQKGEPVIINDVSSLPEQAKAEKDFFTKQSILSVAAAPLIISGEFIGLLGYDSILKKKSGLTKQDFY